MSNSLIRLKVFSLTKGGFGVGSIESSGIPTKTPRESILIPRTVPGDIVDVERDSAGYGKGFGKLVRIVEPSTYRVQPHCPYVDECGCDFMHIDPAFQQSSRVSIVKDELGRAKIPVPDINSHASTQILHYRVRARVAVVANKKHVQVGFRAPKSHRLIEVDSCCVLEPAIDQLRREISSWLSGSSGAGEASLYLGRDGLPAVSLSWDGTLASSVFTAAQNRIDDGEWAGVSLWLKGARVPANLGDPTGVMKGADGLDLYFPPGGFTQANQSMNSCLVNHVANSAVADCGFHGDEMLELFAGSGNFTVALAARTNELSTVEQDKAAVAAANRNVLARGLRCRIREADASQISIRPSVRVAVLDPPRSGSRSVALRIAESRVRKVLMVSCDPATLARDLSILCASRFAVQRLDVFEMFPCTSHVETVALLERSR